MSKASWAPAALLALILPACAATTQSARMETAMSHPRGQAAQPGSWTPSSSDAQNKSIALHSGPRGQAEQPYAWLDSDPAYPVDQHRLAQEGMTHLGGRAAQGQSWPTPKAGRVEVQQLAANQTGRSQQ